MTRLRTLPIAAVAVSLTIGVLASSSPSGAEARAMMVEMPSPPRFDPRVLGAVVRMPSGPPAISGGTLLVLRDGHRVVAADADRDAITILDVDHPVASAIVARVEGLPRGAEPGRSAEDGAGRVHVVLRGARGILSFDPASADERGVIRGARRNVCAMPRGIAYDAGADALHVACRGGELVTLPAASGSATRTLRLDHDLRDVVASGDRLYVTRFRTAEVLVIDAAGAVVDRVRAPSAPHGTSGFASNVAWRALPIPGGGVAMLHQHAAQDEIQPSPGGYGGFRSGGCEGIVRAAVTVVDDGRAIVGPEIADAILAVDFAIAPPATGGGVGRLAVIAAGNQSGEGALIVVDAPPLRDPGCIGGSTVAQTPGLPAITNPIAVAWAGDRRLIVQQRDPAQIVVVAADSTWATQVPLGGGDAFDTGHSIFHASTDAGIACASCHPEGGDDGHVWRFAGIGERRTPALHSVAGTAPFHWNGELADVRALMNEVFVLRMRGQSIDADHAEAVESWLGHVPAPRASDGDAAAIARGRALFEGEGDCASCHAGARLTSPGSADVGTGGSFQVPSLIGVGDRLPLMHDGCAATLRARFDDASCGGDRHGHALDDAQETDLIAYLESL